MKPTKKIIKTREEIVYYTEDPDTEATALPVAVDAGNDTPPANEAADEASNTDTKEAK